MYAAYLLLVAINAMERASHAWYKDRNRDMSDPFQSVFTVAALFNLSAISASTPAAFIFPARIQVLDRMVWICEKTVSRLCFVKLGIIADRQKG